MILRMLTWITLRASLGVYIAHRARIFGWRATVVAVLLGTALGILYRIYT